MATIIDPETGHQVWIDDPDDGPEFLAPATPSQRRPEAPQGPEFMDAGWDDEVPAVEPVHLPVEGGLPLIYDGESHMIYGEGGSGKSWLAYYAAAEVAAAGGVALLLDYESNRRTVRERLKALGVAKEQAGRIAYAKITGSLMGGSPVRATVDAWIEAHQPRMVVLDSVAKSMGAAGLKESDNSDYIRWQQVVVEPWTARRVTSVLIDHTGHPSTEKGRPARTTVAARGASAKKDQVSGASYFFEVEEHWTRSNGGRARLTTAKDREGHRKAWSVAAVMAVSVEDNGSKVAITLTVPQEMPKSEAGEPRYTWYMEQISTLLEETPERLTGNKIGQHLKALGRSSGYADRALKTLVREGYVSASEPGSRGAVFYTLERAYVEAEDPKMQDADPERKGGLF